VNSGNTLVSIVIVSYNTCNLTDDCIASVKAQTQCAYELIVVDNNSTDETISMLNSKYPECILIANSSNPGFAKANNQGFSIAKGKYYLLLNPDTVILDNAIDKLAGFMEINPEVGASGPRNYSPCMQLQHNCDHFPSLWIDFTRYVRFRMAFPNSKLFNAYEMNYWNYSELRKVDRIAGCSLMVRADIYKKLEGLDGSYFMYYEETDLCYRIYKCGYSVVYFPEAAIIHYWGESSKSAKQESVIDKVNMTHYLKSKYYFYRKNYSPMHAVLARSLDFSYGLILWLKNIMRNDPAIRADRLRKARLFIKHTTDLRPNDV